jgi:hypothetical protein
MKSLHVTHASNYVNNNKILKIEVLRVGTMNTSFMVKYY